jgi:hypothetical protein
MNGIRTLHCLVAWLLSLGNYYCREKTAASPIWITPASKKVSELRMIAIHPLHPFLPHNPVPFYGKVIRLDRNRMQLACVLSSLHSTTRKDCVSCHNATTDLTVIKMVVSDLFTSCVHEFGTGLGWYPIGKAGLWGYASSVVVLPIKYVKIILEDNPCVS